MATRIITSLVGLPIIIGLLALGGLPLKIGVLTVSIIGMYEFYKVISKQNLPLHYMNYFLAAIYIFFADSFNVSFLQMFYSLVILANVVSLVFFYKKYNIIDCVVGAFAFFYVAMLLTNAILVRNYENGEFLVWLIFISAWGCDTGAYFFGKMLGKHKLAPILSPNKTIEGSIGGIVTAALLGAVFAFALQYFYETTSFFGYNIIILFSLICACGSICSQLGDLTASAIKRFTKTKDYGNIFPGHGGVLDRFDSVLFTAPCVYAVILILSRA